MDTATTTSEPAKFTMSRYSVHLTRKQAVYNTKLEPITNGREYWYAEIYNFQKTSKDGMLLRVSALINPDDQKASLISVLDRLKEKVLQYEQEFRGD